MASCWPGLLWRQLLPKSDGARIGNILLISIRPAYGGILWSQPQNHKYVSGTKLANTQAAQQAQVAQETCLGEDQNTQHLAQYPVFTGTNAAADSAAQPPVSWATSAARFFLVFFFPLSLNPLYLLLAPVFWLEGAYSGWRSRALCYLLFHIRPLGLSWRGECTGTTPTNRI